MLYVIYVMAGNEKEAETSIRKKVLSKSNRKDEAFENGSLCTACFYPVRHMRRKIRGNWTDCYERVIPGYIFVESERILDLYNELRRLPLFMKLLGKESDDSQVSFQELKPDEARWLYGIMGYDPDNGIAEIMKENPIVGLSQVGFDENDQVKILSGPLESMTGQIRKINLHKRIAEVEVDFMGRKISVYLGVEILNKDR